jgi:hypothetical protein
MIRFPGARSFANAVPGRGITHRNNPYKQDLSLLLLSIILFHPSHTTIVAKAGSACLERHSEGKRELVREKPQVCLSRLKQREEWPSE